MVNNEIFESENKNKNKEFSTSMFSFKDCPNKCIDGYYIDPYKHRKIKCKYCEDLRKSLIKEKITVKSIDINSELNLPTSFSDYSRNIVIPTFVLKNLSEDSVNKVLNMLDSLINDISVGVIPEYSMLFNLGASGHESNFISTYLSRAYISGLSVSPLYSSHEVIVLRNLSESFNDERYSKIIDSDVCILYIENGASSDSITATIGVVQLRAYRNKSTIIFTKTSINKSRLDLNMCPESEKCKDLLVFYSVEYIKKTNEDNEKQSNISSPKSMSKNSFNNLIRESNFL